MSRPYNDEASALPQKIEAAMQFAHYCLCVQWGSDNGSSDATLSSKPATARDLTSNERRAYDAAMANLAEYFNSPGFGDTKPSKSDDQDPPAQQEKVPTPS